MGSVSSKAARRLSGAGSRIQPAPAAEQARRQLAFESKNEAIERDAKDPHFMEKLNQLGQVRVNHHMQKVRTAGDIKNMYHSRIQSETEASNLESTKNRLLASSLIELLEARKSITSNAGLESLARQHHIDIATLQQLGRVVNTPSIDESTIIRATDKHGEESLTMMARWVDPVLSRV